MLVLTPVSIQHFPFPFAVSKDKDLSLRMMTTTLSFLSLAPYAESNEPSTHIQATTAEIQVSFFTAYIIYVYNE